MSGHPTYAHAQRQCSRLLFLSPQIQTKLLLYGVVEKDVESSHLQEGCWAAGAAPRAVACGESGGWSSRESYAPRATSSGVGQAASSVVALITPPQPPSVLSGRVLFVVERSCTLRERSAVCGERMEKVGGCTGRRKGSRVSGRPSASEYGRYRSASTLLFFFNNETLVCRMMSQRRRPLDVGRKKASTEQGTCS